MQTDNRAAFPWRTLKESSLTFVFLFFFKSNLWICPCWNVDANGIDCMYNFLNRSNVYQTGKRRISLHFKFFFFICISLLSDQRQPRKLIPKGTTSGLCYLVCLQGAENEIRKTLVFPLTHLSQRSVWFLCYALPTTTQRLERLPVCYMLLKAIFHQMFQAIIIHYLDFSHFSGQITLRQENKRSKKNDQGMQPKPESKPFIHLYGIELWITLLINYFG